MTATIAPSVVSKSHPILELFTNKKVFNSSSRLGEQFEMNSKNDKGQ